MKLKTSHKKPSETQALALFQATCAPVSFEAYSKMRPDERRELIERMPLESLLELIVVAAVMRATVARALGGPTSGGHVYNRDDLLAGLEAAIAAPTVIAALGAEQKEEN